jgi:hypothetical protein
MVNPKPFDETKRTLQSIEKKFLTLSKIPGLSLAILIFSFSQGGKDLVNDAPIAVSWIQHGMVISVIPTG